MEIEKINIISCYKNEEQILIKSLLNNKQEVFLIDGLADAGYTNFKPVSYTFYCVSKFNNSIKTIEITPTNLSDFIKNINQNNIKTD